MVKIFFFFFLIWDLEGEERKYVLLLLLVDLISGEERNRENCRERGEVETKNKEEWKERKEKSLPF